MIEERGFTADRREVCAVLHSRRSQLRWRFLLGLGLYFVRRQTDCIFIVGPNDCLAEGVWRPTHREYSCWLWRALCQFCPRYFILMNGNARSHSDHSVLHPGNTVAFTESRNWLHQTSIRLPEEKGLRKYSFNYVTLKP